MRDPVSGSPDELYSEYVRFNTAPAPFVPSCPLPASRAAGAGGEKSDHALIGALGYGGIGFVLGGVMGLVHRSDKWIRWRGIVLCRVKVRGKPVPATALLVTFVVNPVIAVSNLGKRYGPTVAVDDVSLEVFEGEIFGLIGPNGAGKTTTMECVEGNRVPDKGTISVLGLDPRRDANALRQRIGVQHQEAHLQKRIKVWEAVDLWRSLYARAVDADALLARLGLEAKRNAWFMTLSGGQKQRLFIALALIHEPEVVFLDELTTGLDPQARRAIWALVTGIRDRGTTVFLTTHLMEEAERLCDRVAIIEHGRIIELGTPADLVKKHCPERTVVFTSDDANVAERLQGFGPVERVEGSGAIYTLRGAGDDFVTDVINIIAREGIRVRGFRTEIPTLEDVFLKLTGHGIRD